MPDDGLEAELRYEADGAIVFDDAVEPKLVFALELELALEPEPDQPSDMNESNGYSYMM
jgi:hypothetical protein